MTQFIIKANTPEDFQKEIVEWLEKQSSIHRVNSSLANLKRTTVVEKAKASVYFDAAEFIKGMKIERKD